MVHRSKKYEKRLQNEWCSDPRVFHANSNLLPEGHAFFNFHYFSRDNPIAKRPAGTTVTLTLGHISELPFRHELADGGRQIRSTQWR